MTDSKTSKNTSRELIKPLAVQAPLWSHYTPPAAFYAVPRTADYWSYIEAMLLDEELSGALSARKSTAQAFPWRLEGGGEQSMAFVKEVLEGFGFSRAVDDAHDRTAYGIAVLEVVWLDPGMTGGWWRVASVERRDPRKFRFNRDGSLAYHDGMMWRPAPDKKFIVFTRKATAENPYGQSALVTLYPVWQAKWTAWAQLLRLGEKHSIPGIIALTDANDEKELEQISETLKAIEAADGAALSGVKQIVELGVTGKTTELVEVLRYCDIKIWERLTGQSLATKQGDTGTYAQAREHGRTARKKAGPDAEAVAETLSSTLIRWICELNGLPDPPRMTYNTDEPPTLEEYMQAVNGGVSVSAQAFYADTGIPAPADENDVLAVNRPQPRPAAALLSDPGDLLLLKV